ncbi:D-alanyl-D-alanine carboxypeptidase family protein [Candidatus Omnitrophota bacterium]
MFKRLPFLLIPLFFLSVFSFAFAKQDVPLTADAAILMDPWTKRILYSKNPHIKLPLASTAKIMTALVVLKKSYLKRKVVVSRFASSMEPSKVHIKEGEVYLTEDLLKALLLNSGNDASVALAEGVAGSEENFVKMMNRMARAIGAKNTNFRNSNGLPAEGQYSTAYDLALMVREAMKYKDFVDTINIKDAEIEELNAKRRIKLKNHNKALWKDGVYLILGKTGYTKKARHCFAGYIQYNRWRKVIVVTLKGRKMWSDLESLAKERF